MAAPAGLETPTMVLAGQEAALATLEAQMVAMMTGKAAQAAVALTVREKNLAVEQAVQVMKALVRAMTGLAAPVVPKVLQMMVQVNQEAAPAVLEVQMIALVGQAAPVGQAIRVEPKNQSRNRWNSQLR